MVQSTTCPKEGVEGSSGHESILAPAPVLLPALPDTLNFIQPQQKDKSSWHRADSQLGLWNEWHHETDQG